MDGGRCGTPTDPGADPNRGGVLPTHPVRPIRGDGDRRLDHPDTGHALPGRPFRAACDRGPRTRSRRPGRRAGRRGPTRATGPASAHTDRRSDRTRQRHRRRQRQRQRGGIVIVAVVISTVLLSIAGIVSIVHVARSVGVPDRAVGLDLLTATIINMLAVTSAWSFQPAVAVLILLLTLLAFLGSVAVARFLDRTRS
ncbi:MAG: hypothetical protein FJW94_02760 [Actinobacteria bacterium]|nr:hypothetical protein [Actinomycetota bacterium]